MNRCILMYCIKGRNQQEDIWFENFADAFKHMRGESWAWSSWAILHIGRGIKLAYSHADIKYESKMHKFIEKDLDLS